MRVDTKVYKQLAEKLDAVPNGFPQTIKGLKLLAKIFTPEEAAIASKMRLTLESAKTIARRLGKNQATIENKLAEMVQKGLIRSRQIEGAWRFWLMPFVVGFYVAQLVRLDKEMAQLFEEYYKDFVEGVLDKSPSLHKVIPINKSIPVEIQVFPYEQISTLLQKAKSFGVIPRCSLNISSHVSSSWRISPPEGSFFAR